MGRCPLYGRPRPRARRANISIEPLEHSFYFPARQPLGTCEAGHVPPVAHDGVGPVGPLGCRPGVGMEKAVREEAHEGRLRFALHCSVRYRAKSRPAALMRSLAGDRSKEPQGICLLAWQGPAPSRNTRFLPHIPPCPERNPGIRTPWTSAFPSPQSPFGAPICRAHAIPIKGPETQVVRRRTTVGQPPGPRSARPSLWKRR